MLRRTLIRQILNNGVGRTYTTKGGLNWGYPQQYYLNRHHLYKSATYNQSGENYLSFVNYFVTLAVAR
jgi:hypothetical protein